MHRYEEALSSYAQALTINPNYDEIIHNLSILKLEKKCFSEAWRLYESRIRTAKFKINEISHLEKPLFVAREKCKNLLLIREQGIGDQILYASLIDEFEKWNIKLSALINHKLFDLFKRSFIHINFITLDSQIDNTTYDHYLPFGNLGNFFRDSIGSFEAQPKKFLYADEMLTNKLRIQLNEDGKYICGIAWKSKNEDFGQDKSIVLESLLPILKLPHITFVNLQYGDTKEEIEALNKTYGIYINTIDEIDNFNDIDKLASLIDACDFVVTTSNVTVHLAGGLGKETYLMTPFAQGRIWYWHEGDTKSIWYPSVNIHSQPSPDNWTNPIDDIAHILEKKN